MSTGINLHDYGAEIATATAKFRLAEAHLSKSQTLKSKKAITTAQFAADIWRGTFDCTYAIACRSKIMEPLIGIGEVANEAEYMEWANNKKFGSDSVDRNQLVSALMSKVSVATNSAIQDLP